MATKKKDLSEVKIKTDKRFAKFNIGIVVSDWNAEITTALFQGTMDSLLAAGVKEKNIYTIHVPGAFELPLASQWMASDPDMDAVIALGCVIQGETPHFTFISDAVANGLMDVGLTFSKPVVFGVLTTNNMQQAKERSGGKHGNKGTEATATALSMLSLTLKK